ncbi:ALG9 isoform 16, partial [Pan troglodytes]
KYSSNKEEWISLAYRPFLDASSFEGWKTKIMMPV